MNREREMRGLLNKGLFLSIELSPNLQKNIDTYLKNKDFLNILPSISSIILTDSPLGRYTHNAIVSSIYVQQQTNINTVATFAMRDKNTPYALAQIRSSEMLNLTSYLFLTGDKTQEGKNVFEKNSTDFLKEVCFQKRKYDLNTLMFATCSNKLTDNQKKKIRKKVMNGADALVTQPITDYKEAEILREYFNELKSEKIVERDFNLVIGFFPIVTLRTAKFIRNNVPGAEVSDTLYALLEEDKAQEAFLWNKKVLNKLLEKEFNIHLMTANDFHLMNKLLYR